MTVKDNNFTHKDGVTLKEYFDSRLQSIEDAIGVARLAMETRLAGMNEFRESLRDQTNRSMSREEYQAAHDRVKEDIQSLRESRAELAGKASQMSVNISLLISILGLVTSLVSVTLLLIHKLLP